MSNTRAVSSAASPQASSVARRVTIKVYAKFAEDRDIRDALAGLPARARAAAIRQALRDALPHLSELVQAPSSGVVEVTIRTDRDPELYRLLTELPHGTQSGVVKAAIRKALSAGTFASEESHQAAGQSVPTKAIDDPLVKMLHAFD